MERKKEHADKTELGQVLIPDSPDRDTKYRLNKYIDWLIESQRDWHAPDLVTYRDFLLAAGSSQGKPLSPITVRAHLSTIRTRYQDIIKEQTAIRAVAARLAEAPSGQAAQINLIINGIERAIDPDLSPVETSRQEQRHDEGHLYLSEEQVQALVAAPGTDTLVGLRDTAVIAMMVGTGIRELELSAVNVEDLRHNASGELALRVHATQSTKERLVPYGQFRWVLGVVEKWLHAAGIENGPAFRSFWRGGQRLRGRLGMRAIQNIVSGYPMVVDGELTSVRPTDLRQTYARRCLEAMNDLDVVRVKLGLATLRAARNLLER